MSKTGAAPQSTQYDDFPEPFKFEHPFLNANFFILRCVNPLREGGVILVCGGCQTMLCILDDTEAAAFARAHHFCGQALEA